MIYAVRHGETNWNKEGRIQGCSGNPPLNEQGFLQARQLAEKLKGLDITTIYSSDLLRVRQTVAEINKVLNVPVIETPLLRETNYGILEGQPVSITETNADYKKICDAVDGGDFDAHFPDGESRNMVINRVMTLLKQINNAETVLLATHGGLIRSFACYYAQLDKKIPNCGGIRFDLSEDNLPQDIELF